MIKEEPPNVIFLEGKNRGRYKDDGKSCRWPNILRRHDGPAAAIKAGHTDLLEFQLHRHGDGEDRVSQPHLPYYQELLQGPSWGWLSGLVLHYHHSMNFFPPRLWIWDGEFEMKPPTTTWQPGQQQKYKNSVKFLTSFCLEQLERCQRTSLGPSFILLVG